MTGPTEQPHKSTNASCGPQHQTRLRAKTPTPCCCHSSKSPKTPQWGSETPPPLDLDTHSQQVDASLRLQRPAV
eukprot:9439576-Pyramimonas_sp.AAC.1